MQHEVYQADFEEYLNEVDPRDIGDLEQENIDLKEKMIHTMTTLEQYLQIVQVYQKENPYSFADLSDEISQIQSVQPGSQNNLEYQNYKSSLLKQKVVPNTGLAKRVTDQSHKVKQFVKGVDGSYSDT